jgi:hypothetical protein
MITMIGYIYKIHCNITGEDYYGSTTCAVEVRIYTHVHKGTVNRPCASDQIISRNDWTHETVEEVNYEEKKELLLRERYYIETYPCINILVPYRTKEEWREYDKLKRRRLRLNPETARREKEYARIKHTCPCGGSYSNDSRAEHFRTKKHQRYIDNN